MSNFQEPTCHNCGTVGHTKRNCSGCFRCHDYEHSHNECPEATCAFCHEKGHTKWICPVIPPCPQCGEKGHKKQQCPKISSSRVGVEPNLASQRTNSKSSTMDTLSGSATKRQKTENEPKQLDTHLHLSEVSKVEYSYCNNFDY
jgi:hypothetical protein